VNGFAFFRSELWYTKLSDMKQATIIPLVKSKDGSFIFKVQTIKNFLENRSIKQEGPHSHNYYEMIWLTRGNGTLWVDMQGYPVENNTIHSIKPNQTHQFQMQEGMDGFVFSFMDSFFKMDEYDFDWAGQDGLFQLFTEGRSLRIPNEMEEELKDIVWKMIREFENEQPHRMEILKRFFKIFLIYLTRWTEGHMESTEHSRETELVKNFLESLDKNFKEKKMVAEYAGELLVTPTYLNRIVKKITGTSAGHQIRQRVVLEAKRMGRYSGAGMKEIAYRLGFLDPAHFSRFFKAFAGINFSDFKRGALRVSMTAAPLRA
jgi:AraC-like DNA-binding protein/mannose-6-phosphate isomerase-like protein (cupin superfamily)